MKGIGVSGSPISIVHKVVPVPLAKNRLGSGGRWADVTSQGAKSEH